MRYAHYKYCSWKISGNLRAKYLNSRLYDCQMQRHVKYNITSEVILVKDGKVLLTKKESTDGSSKWAVPNGAVNTAETPKDAAVRECLAKTGFDAKDIKLVANRVFEKADDNFLLYFTYLCKDGICMSNASITNIEQRWVSPNELESEEFSTLAPELKNAIRTKIE
jgi:ADP-ribose pyrophosphatase YjhB (NUDIX family)